MGGGGGCVVEGGFSGSSEVDRGGMDGWVRGKERQPGTDG